MALCNINEEKGYHKKPENTTEQATGFDENLKALLTVPPPKRNDENKESKNNNNNE